MKMIMKTRIYSPSYMTNRAGCGKYWSKKWYWASFRIKGTKFRSVFGRTS